MAATGLGISGRVEQGEVLRAVALGSATGLQWQALVNNQWVSVGTAGSTTFTVPSGAAGTAYRLAGQIGGTTVYSEPTAPATADRSQANAPVLTNSNPVLTVSENSAGAKPFAALTLTDADRTNYGGGSLLVLDSNAAGSGGDGQDQLSILTGTAAGSFSYNAATRTLSYRSSSSQTVTIGTVDAALNGQGTHLKIAFNSSATVAIVDALIDNLQFASNDDSPTTARLLTLRVADSTGGSVQRVATVNVTPANDAPVWTGPASFTVQENTTAVAALQASDADNPDGGAQGLAFSLAAGEGSQDNALFLIDAATGVLRFADAPDFEDAQHAPQYSVRVRVTDAQGAFADRVLAIAVSGVNEAPTAQDAVAQLSENGEPVKVLPVFGDPDAGDSVQLALDVAGTVGNVTRSGSVFLYDAAGRFEHLGAGQQALDRFSYTVTDSAGLSTTRTVTVTVLGQNDAPLLGGTLAGAVSEAGPSGGGGTRASGRLQGSDVDSGDTLSYAGSADGQYGSLVLDSQTGAWTYFLDDARAATQALRQGEQRVDAFTVRVTDSQGAASEQQVRITVTGANDLPVLTGALTGSVSEAGAAGAGTASAAGQLTAADVDAGETLSFAGSAAGQYGSLVVDSQTGAWTYTLDNTKAATQALGEGQVQQEAFTVSVTDAAGARAQQTVQVFVAGSNDAPGPIGGTTAGTAHEAAAAGKVQLPIESTGSGYAVVADPQDRLLVLGTLSPSGGQVLQRLAADGRPDVTFGVEGSVSVMSGATRLAIDAEGAYLLAGQQGSNLVIGRYLADGTPDPAYGTGGWSVLPNPGGMPLADLATAPDGSSYLVLGYTGGGSVASVVHVQADGSLDTAFGQNGTLDLAFGGKTVEGLRIAVDEDGHLHTMTAVYDGTSFERSVIVSRREADGSLDADYGNAGSATASLGTFYAHRFADAILEADGSVVVAWGKYFPGSSMVYRPQLTRLDASGSPDSDFGAAGTADVQVGLAWSNRYDLAVDAQGRYLLAVSAGYGGNGETTLLRTDSDGALDPTFGLDGRVGTGASASSEARTTAIPLPGGGVVVSGAVPGSMGFGSQTGLWRYDEDGHPKLGFGNPVSEMISGWLWSTDPEGSPLTWSGSADGVYGVFAVDAWGGWTYSVDDSRPATEALATGQSVTETFTVTATDAAGASTSQQVIVTLVGADDVPLS